MTDKNRVLVAMSGGVDSAVAAALLHRQGYEVSGVTLRLYTETDENALRSRRVCCGVEDVEDARTVARNVGFPHYVLNMEREFEDNVIDYFVNEYANGRTPNPCLACNERVKFATLLDQAIAMGFDFLATGHYARIAHNDENFQLLEAIDKSKDQSYVLYTLNQQSLSRTLFPVGTLPKSETRRIASEIGLSVATKPDSADICFVPSGDYRSLLRQRGVEMRPGPITTRSGVVVGNHSGTAGYTVGQRRGLGSTGPERRFVTSVDAASNVVVIGTENELRADDLYASDPRWVGNPPTIGESVQARIRYHAAPAEAVITELKEDSFRIEFQSPVRAIAPGQAVVLYRGYTVVGGGIIEPPYR